MCNSTRHFNMEKFSFGKLDIEITRRCNLHCEHCMRGEAQNIDMSYDTIDNILDQVCAIDKLQVTGGEPFIAKDKILYLYEQIMKRKIIVLETQIVTNGMMIDEDISEMFKRFNNYLKDWYESITNEKFSEDFIKKHIQICISSDKYHDNDSENLFDKVDALLGKYCIVTLYNRGNQVKDIGRAKRLACGSLVSKTTLRRIAIFGKNYPCYCKTVNEELRQNQPDYYTIMCPVQITAKGIMTQFMESDFEEEDKDRYVIVDFSKKEDILSGIERYNKDKQWCAYINIVERDNDWYENHGTLDWNMRSINFMSEKYNNDIEEKNNPKYRSFEIDTEEYLKLYKGNNREEKIQELIKDTTLREDEDIIADVEYGSYKDIFLRYQGLNKDECRRIYLLEKSGGFANENNREKLKNLISENFIRIMKKELQSSIHSGFSQENRRKAYLILLKEKCNNDMNKLYELYKKSFAENIDFGKYKDIIPDITTMEQFESFMSNKWNEWESIKMYFASKVQEIIETVTFDGYELRTNLGYYDEIIRRLAVFKLYREYEKDVKYKSYANSDWLEASYEDIVKPTLDSLERFYIEVLKSNATLMYLENERCKMLNKPLLYSDEVIGTELFKHPIQFMKTSKLINKMERIYKKK